ncbi:MAG: DUF3857 domain-containing protein, partial [Flavobacteriaceae bacterium]|nr:DUF3857 domain-containing protein [Flavobacteriaceae bacterium]
MKYFLLSFLFGCLIAYTQTDTPEVTYEDLNATSCPIDAEASAYYIYEKGSSFINLTTFELVTNYQARIKILNKNAFRVGNITITLQKTKNGTENLSELTGKTYNLENNTIVSHTLDKEHVYIDDSNQYIKLVKFSLPNIKKGSIIEYHYTKKSPFVFNFKNWNFQDYIPKLYSQYDTKIPAIFQYRKKLLGYLDFETHTAEIESNCINQGKVKSDCAIETYAMKNIPAFKEESFMLSPENYISQLEFELLSTDWINGKKHYTKEWNDIDQDLRFNYSLGKEAKSKANFKDAVTQEIKDLEYNLIKAKRIYYYLQNILLWNKKVDVFKAFDLKKTLEDKIGSSTELNMILLNTLKAYGFDAKIMLLSTRANGKVTKLHPSISEFNYMIVNLVIQGQTHLLDISNKFKKFGDLPFKCYNHYGRVMDFKKGSYWQDIIPKNKLIRNSDIHFTIEDDLVKGHARIKNEGFISSSKRAMYFKNKEKYLKYFENGGTIQLL